MTTVQMVSLVQLLKALGFKQDASGTRWTRTFGAAAYPITCDVGSSPSLSKIDFGPAITSGRLTTGNFSQAETSVVLECVCRLLDQGHSPSDISLEEPYKVGHDFKYLDILVRKDSAPYLMIECKTPGSEYKSELVKLARDGGQVLSYFIQDRSAEWLVVYTSDYSKGAVKPEYVGLSTQGLMGSSLQDVFSSWDKETFSSGLFDGEPYSFRQQTLYVGDLEDMRQSDGSIIFNEFEEILRRHVVSDKPNAFNKIFNLFICKIFDEQKLEEDEEVEFQWRNGEPPELVLNRLSDLYKLGVREFLRMEVADHSLTEVEQAFGTLDPAHRSKLLKMFEEVRLYKNNEFAFLEVYDQKSFNDNAAVVREVVRLIQKKRLRYGRKQPFMGDFFERLLNTSVKQEAGQFFTPLPIAKFIVDSLPVEGIVAQKVSEQRADFLPYIMDYAAGSGHFLTEAMDRVDAVLQSYLKPGSSSLKRQQQKQNATSWSNAYAWAKTFVFGIERDYRLAKTAKVSCFLNGDGEANVIRANGLASFHSSPEYREAGGVLPTTHNGRDNGNFDMVVANPPFSVRHCKRTIEHGKDSFELWDRMSAASPEIEVLFLERTKQLLRAGGVAGVIFPNSILQNAGLGADARHFLLKNFEIISVVALGSNTFMKTGIGTVILFLKRRTKESLDTAQASASRIVALQAKPQDLVLEAAYAADVFGMTSQEYRDALMSPSTCEHEVFSDRRDDWLASDSRGQVTRTRTYRDSDDHAQEKLLEDDLRKYVAAEELRRVEAFSLVYGRNVLAISAPSEKGAEEQFLGYRFSSRRGREGMMLLSGEDDIETPLFDPNDINSTAKLATYVRSAFGNSELPLPADLQGYGKWLSPTELIDFNAVPFEFSMRTRAPVVSAKFVVGTVRLSEACDIAIGGTPATNAPRYYTGGDNLWVSIKDMSSPTIFDTKKKITDDAVKASNVKLIQAGTTLVSFKLTVGKVSIAGKDLYTNEAIAAISPKAEWAARMPQEYIQAIFALFARRLMNVEGVGGKKLGTVMNKRMLGELRLPLLDDASLKAFMKKYNDKGLAASRELEAMIWAPTPSSPD